jgi:hypothetical protein
VHRISIFPLQAVVHFTHNFQIRFGNYGIVAEYSITCSFAENQDIY